MLKSWGSQSIYLAYKNAKFGQIKADIFRYCIVYELGGYYFDISKGCRVALDTLHSPNSLGLITNESNDRTIAVSADLLPIYDHPNKLFVQWGFGFAPQNPILKKAISLIEEQIDDFNFREFTNPTSAILDFSGTHLFTRAVDEYVKSNGIIGITQSGIDFHHNGIFSLTGSNARYLQVPNYKLSGKSKIL
jgi:mannosyltransferase OCH1-like enzyme